jgi:uncharacterized RDD family membrane protein YckC
MRPAASGDARLGQRAAAFLVDLAVLIVIAFAALVGLGWPSNPLLAMERLRRAAEGWTALVVLLYFATLEAWGGTAGKRLFALNVETTDGDRIGYFRAL